MPTLFILQIILSGIIWGILVSILSIIAEGSSSKVSGIVLSLPSTAVVSLFFIGLTIWDAEIAKATPSILTALWLWIWFTILYVTISTYVSPIIEKKIYCIFFTWLLSIFLWGIWAYYIYILQIENIWIWITLYILWLISGHFYIKKQKNHEHPVIHYTSAQKIGRALFISIVIGSAVYTAKILWTTAWGLASMFPAALSSSLIVFHWYYEPKYFFSYIRKIPIGTLSCFIYIICVSIFFPLYWIWIGTLIAIISSISVAHLLLKFNK